MSEGERVPVDRHRALEQVLDDGGVERDRRVKALYDAVATNYHLELSDELTHKPFDRWLLNRIAQAAGGALLDVGCGTGHITEFLSRCGAVAVGLDLSDQMIRQARQAYPELTFRTGSMFDLPPVGSGGGWAVITCWYGMVHLAPSELRSAFESFRRVIIPGGRVAVALHVGDEVRHVDQLFGQPVDAHFVLHDTTVVLAAAEAAGLVVAEWYVRGPIPQEAQTQRLYLVAEVPS